jgi:tRNA A-37 threonylcarbamoyl transferase component Bud32
VDGRVCIRKRYRGLRLGARRWGDQPVPLRQRLHLALWNSLGLFLYSEAAALLRLRDLPFVPKLRRIDLADRAIYVDYLQGENLRSIAARSGAAVHDTDLKMAQLNGMSGRDLDRREVALLDAVGDGDFRSEIASMAREINARGVAPLDIKLGNFIRGAITGRLYWIDFELSRLSSQPRWEMDLAAQHETLERLFGIARA